MSGKFSVRAVASILAVAISGSALGQGASSPEQQAMRAATHAEWQREMNELGLTTLRPGADTSNSSSPYAVNYDESKANLFPLPDPLVAKDGKRITTLRDWERSRRPEVLRLVTEELYGAVPDDVPGITWRVDEQSRDTVEGIAVVTKHLTGHANNSADPSITVDIKADLVTPEGTTGRKVPVIVIINNLRPFAFARPPGAAVLLPNPYEDYRKQILSRGWAYVIYDPTSVQTDNGAGLTSGIIGLANKGKARSLIQWGVLRAWAWGASRVLDYLQTDSGTDATKAAIFGHSRYGKTALVAMAYDRRYATGYISSSGKGGAAPYRRRWGEMLENLANDAAFHWMVAGYMRYSANPHTANDLDVDSDDVIALVAPRPIFVSAGLDVPTPGKPDDSWVDAHGSWMAVDMAGDVYALYGRKRLSRTLPPMLTLSDSGDLAFRQHDQGHTPAPNWSYFLDFAARQFAK
jgi:hypothetical protein